MTPRHTRGTETRMALRPSDAHRLPLRSHDSFLIRPSQLKRPPRFPGSLAYRCLRSQQGPRQELAGHYTRYTALP